MDVSLTITDGQMAANVVIIEGDPDVHSVRNLLDASVRSIVDLIGYQHGVRYDLDIVSASSMDAAPVIFGINIPVLAERRKSTSSGSISGKLLSAIGRETHAQMALADFRAAMGSAVGTGFHCYRAIETMMQSMKPDDAENDNAGWQRLRESLRIDRPAIEFVKGHADLPRHGRPSHISDDDRAKVFKITDEIIRRYLEYLEGGKKALAELDFSQLTI
jgi:hypothetical protein